MDPEIWGPKLWFMLHTISFNYPDNPSFDDMKYHQDFFEILVHIIPCATCANHYSEYISKNPPKLSSKKDLIKWTIDLHNNVNQRLGKKIYTYNEAVNLIANSFTKEEKETKSFFKWYFVAILGILLLVAYYIYLRSLKKIRFKRG